MNRREIISLFRSENPEITTRVASNTLCHSWLKVGNRDICARTRCIVNIEPETITTLEDEENWDLAAEISKFYCVDEYPGGGIAYNDKRLEETSIARLDEEQPGWRTADAGTPTKYFGRGTYIYTNRPVDSNAYDLKVYAVLIPDDFDADTKTPYNELTHLEPFHPLLTRYLKMRAKEKIAKREDALLARTEYLTGIEDMKKMLGGGKYDKIYLRRKQWP